MNEKHAIAVVLKKKWLEDNPGKQKDEWDHKIHLPKMEQKYDVKWVFGSECDFNSHTLNAKKLGTIECSFPVKNYPMECGFCKESFWRHDMEKHFAKDHPGQECPTDGFISAQEKEILKKKARNTKNNLLISDLSKLTDAALKILPLKDFWDAKKKEWKKSVYGTFGKQQSVRMKRLFGESNFA